MSMDNFLSNITSFDELNEKEILLYSEVTLFEDEKTIISTNNKFLINNLIQFIELYPNSIDEIRLLNLLQIVITNNNSEFELIKICKYHNLLQRLNYQIANLLEKGDCRVFDKSTGRYVNKILMQEYSNHLADLFGEGGRHFKKDNEVFFTICDWTS